MWADFGDNNSDSKGDNQDKNSGSGGDDWGNFDEAPATTQAATEPDQVATE